LYGWTGQQSGSGFINRPREPLGEFLRLRTGFELPSSWHTRPCYGTHRNRNSFGVMSWHQIDLGAQDPNDIQRPKSFQKIAGSKVLDEYYKTLKKVSPIPTLKYTTDPLKTLTIVLV
jgi:hypothetical protein